MDQICGITTASLKQIAIKGKIQNIISKFI